MLLKKNKAANKDVKVFLTKGLQYEFVIFPDKDFSDELVMSLFDAKEHLLICSYNETSGFKAQKFKFTCRVTGEYTLSYYLDKNAYCGLILLGNVKKRKKINSFFAYT